MEAYSPNSINAQPKEVKEVKFHPSLEKATNQITITPSE